MDRVHIDDGRVRRPAMPWTPTVHALLRHLRARGFPAPEPLSLDDTEETLSLIPGESGAQGWAKVVPEDGLRAYARFLRRFHQATERFDGAGWAFRGRAAVQGEVICHGDYGPWNVVWDDTEPIGLIDFDFAGPDDPIRDVTYALEYTAPFRSDEEALRWLRYPTPPDRRRRIEVFAEAYGLATTDGLVDAVIERQRTDIDRVRDLAARAIEPQRTWVADGYLHELEARVEWSRRHASELVPRSAAGGLGFRIVDPDAGEDRRTDLPRTG